MAWPSRVLALWCAFLMAGTTVSAEPMLFSDSLNSCQANNSFSASSFEVTLTPNNNSVSFALDGSSTISGYITAELRIFAYGLSIQQETINPCKIANFGMCPMSVTTVDMPKNNINVPDSVLKAIPGIAYSVPDLDASVQVYINKTNDPSHQAVACIEANLSNGKTVNQKAVAWISAVIAGLALVASAVTSGLGHSNTAAHVAANAMALFGYFQAQAFVGMLAVPLPPIVASWTQNFQWTMGIIHVDFLQTLATWYQRATGGSPSTIVSSAGTISVQVEKRTLIPVKAVLRRAASSQATEVVVKGIQRVGFKAGIEPTNIFLTGYIFFVIFVVLVVLGVLLTKVILDALVKSGKMESDKFQDFRLGWNTVLKGIIFRIVLIAYPQMVVLCFWEFTRNMQDSAAETALAAFTIICMLGILAWASSKVIRLARHSIALHGNPAYILYSDPESLNKWGFFYVQYRAAAYYFMVPTLIYILTKGLFVALVQSNSTAQAVGLLVLELAFLIAVCVIRPFMDKKVNAFNISICVINFINAVCALVFTNVFHQPGIVTGVLGVVFFIYNAIFSTVLLIIVLVASVIAIVSKNPDTRYQPMQDERGSLNKSEANLTTELDALSSSPRSDRQNTNPFGDDKDVARVDVDAAPVDSANYPSQAPPDRHMPPQFSNRPALAPSFGSPGQPGQQPPMSRQQAPDHGMMAPMDRQYTGGPGMRPPPQRQPPPGMGGMRPPPNRQQGPGPGRMHPPPNRQQGPGPGPGSGPPGPGMYPPQQRSASPGMRPPPNRQQPPGPGMYPPQQRSASPGMRPPPNRQQNASPWQRGAGYN